MHHPTAEIGNLYVKRKNGRRVLILFELNIETKAHGLNQFKNAREQKNKNKKQIHSRSAQMIRNIYVNIAKTNS